jgi:GDP-D-mannose 3',5'-epimerase
LTFWFFVVFRLTKSDFREPVNIGSDEMVSMNEMAEIVLGFENKKTPIHHIPGPEGVRGRNSDNTLIKEKLGWAPTMKLKVLIISLSENHLPIPSLCTILKVQITVR